MPLRPARAGQPGLAGAVTGASWGLEFALARDFAEQAGSGTTGGTVALRLPAAEAAGAQDGGSPGQ